MSDLIIEDCFYQEMGEYFKSKGQHLENIGSDYISILRLMKRKGICSGETADALDEYIKLALKIRRCVSILSSSVELEMENYITAIDSIDGDIF